MTNLLTKVEICSNYSLLVSRKSEDCFSRVRIVLIVEKFCIYDAEELTELSGPVCLEQTELSGPVCLEQPEGVQQTP